MLSNLECEKFFHLVAGKLWLYLDISVDISVEQLGTFFDCVEVDQMHYLR